MAIERLKRLTMRADSIYIPKSNPSNPRGEDANFISNEAQVIAVADGVGGWAGKGIDAGNYARQLMGNAAHIVKKHSGGFQAADLCPRQILQEAFLKTDAPGSSTACIISLAGNHLRAANLGDSGFMVIRGGKSFYRSPVQHHSFNFPYQMGKSSGGVDAAEEVVVAVERGDIVVLGTDGLFDNVFPEDIERIVEFCLENRYIPVLVAWMLAMEASRNSLDTRAASPFQLAAHDAGVEHFGGKYDDITVVVAFIV
ncbi:hypothetical protein OROGR_006620 [Orobanche gracilis]